LLTWTERILSVPVRAAAVHEFLRELSAKGWGDLNGMLATLNDGELCREALAYWLDHEWITRAPNSPMTALVGPAYSRALTVQEFCGQPEEDEFAPSPEEKGENDLADSPGEKGEEQS
jgi:hypothetical protein